MQIYEREAGRMRFGDIMIGREEKLGRWISCQHSNPIDVFAFNRAAQKHRADPAVSIVWPGSLTPVATVNWLISLQEIVGNQFDCLVELVQRGAKDGRRRFQSPFASLKHYLLDASGEVVLQPATEQFDFYISGNLASSDSSKRIDNDGDLEPDIEFSLSARDICNRNTFSLVAAFIASTSNMKMLPQEIEYLLKEVHKLDL